MSGMFYSLQEAAEKLNKTKEELQEIVKAGKLREFRDGPNLLFKVDEVETLMSDTSVMGTQKPAAPQPPAPEAPELEVPEIEAAAPEVPDLDIPEAEIPPDLEAAEIPAPEMEIPELQEPVPAEASAPEIPESEVPVPEAPVPPPSEPQADSGEILLAPETGVPLPLSELTNADTAITGEGITVLGESDQDYDVTEDTLGETVGTVGTVGTTGTTPEASLEEIEDDVNLDSFGSGSGLLDLSLQADDTSLGGILDEIYTAEEEDAEPAEAGTVEDVVAEADQMLADEELVAPQVAPEMSAFAQVRYDPPPDKASNILGAMLILPILLAFYTAIVALSGQRDVAPFAMTAIQGFIWYIMGGLIVAAIAVGIWAFMAGAEATGVAKKPKKPKKARKPKKAKRGKGLPPSTPEDSVA